MTAAQDPGAAAAAQAQQTNAVQTGFGGAASEALAAAVTAATPGNAKPAAKAQDGAQAVKAASAVTTGFQSETTAADTTASATATASSNATAPTTATPDGRKHADDATTGAKAASDNGTPATQPAAPAPQHPGHTTDAAPQPQTGAADGTQQQSLAGTLAQPQAQSVTTSAPATPQYNVAVAANIAVPLSGLAVQIAATAQSGKSRFEIRLDPADLGRIDVRLDVDRQGRVTSHLTVEKPETLAMLRQDAPQLQRALQDAGLKTGDNGLQFSLRDQSSQGQTARDDTGRNAHRLIVTEDDNIAPVATAGRTYGRMLGSSGGLDIRV
jgi:flagellar hook-length control protein FliK